ncbi:MAG: GldG family protein [Kiritimatiellae bacterium]|nr:GldG family protein [Kiritimatiellia bacterium]MDW8458445.1 GldG family protein [Verrucomicrobiota bacterium]
MKRERENLSADQRGGVGRRIALGLNAGAAVALAAALVVMVNYLSHRHYVRSDISRSQFYTLSDKTRSLLASLTSAVDVVVFFQPDHPSLEDVINLLKEYQHISPHIRVDRVDPHRDIGRTEALVRQYDINAINLVIFSSLGRTKVVNGEDLVEMDFSDVLAGESPRPSSFRGEQLFTSAIHSLTQERPPVVYFLRGHGERDINDRDPYTGYSAIAQHARRDNIEVRDLLLSETRQIPADASALVIPGPTKNLAEAEIDLIRAWLNNSGRLMILLDNGPTAGLRPLIEEWGIRLQDGAAVDPLRSLTGLDIFVSDYGIHPITKGLRDIATVFYLPRAVEPEALSGDTPQPVDRPRVTVLARTSPDSWAESDLEQRPMRFDAARDRRGPISIAVAAERGAAPHLEMSLRPSRLVVFGDTDFLSNGAQSSGNADFFLSALNWLLEREALMAISPKPIEEIRLVMTREQVSRVFWFTTVILPGLIAAAGAGVWWQRRT